jgi:hypothetical protein
MRVTRAKQVSLTAVDLQEGRELRHGLPGDRVENQLQGWRSSSGRFRSGYWLARDGFTPCAEIQITSGLMRSGYSARTWS